MEHAFTGPSYTIGIEEELMIVDGEHYDLVNAIEALLEAAPEGDVQPELMESVLEIATKPCANTAEAGRELRGLRSRVRDSAAGRATTSARRGRIRSRCGRTSGSSRARATAT